jgi:hypothetical protein
MLESCFAKDPEWTQETVEYVKLHTQLNYVQIYKWGWDQKKKVEKNPEAMKIPTIDEFGGYCKFSQDNKTPLDKLLEVDWNEKIRLLDLECEKEHGPVSDFEPNEVYAKRQKLEDSEVVVKKSSPPAVNLLVEVSEEDSLSPPPKKTKRERYTSDITNASGNTPEGKKEQVEIPLVPPFNFDEECQLDEDDDAFKLIPGAQYQPHSFKYDFVKVIKQFLTAFNLLI